MGSQSDKYEAERALALGYEYPDVNPGTTSPGNRMTIKTYEIQPLFAVPYFRAEIGHAISPEQINFIQQLKMIKNKDNLISEKLYIFDEPELASIKEAVHEALDIYADEVMGITQKLYVTQSWALTNESHVGMHTHSHSNSIVSGSLYYCELPQPPARMMFDRHTSYRQLELNPQKEKQNIYNTPINILTPKTNDLLLFPSNLNHLVEPNTTYSPRHAIAFNCFIKGKLGDYRDVSELNL